MSLERALKLTLGFEGGYVEHPNDPGGPTNQGITQKTYDGWRTKQRLCKRSVREIETAEVHAIYERDYWLAAGCDKLGEPLDILHFDAAVHHGAARAAKLLKLSGGKPVAYLDAREKFMRHLVTRKPTVAVFLRGWLNRIGLLRAAIATGL